LIIFFALKDIENLNIPSLQYITKTATTWVGDSLWINNSSFPNTPMTKKKMKKNKNGITTTTTNRIRINLSKDTTITIKIIQLSTTIPSLILQHHSLIARTASTQNLIVQLVEVKVLLLSRTTKEPRTHSSHTINTNKNMASNRMKMTMMVIILSKSWSVFVLLSTVKFQVQYVLLTPPRCLFKAMISCMSSNSLRSSNHQTPKKHCLTMYAIRFYSMLYLDTTLHLSCMARQALERHTRWDCIRII